MFALRFILAGLLAVMAVAISGMGYAIFWFTWGKVDSWESGFSLYYGLPNKAPHSTISLPPTNYFRENQPYTIFLDLTIPITRSNVELGNFMVSLDLLDDSSNPIHSSKVSTLISSPPLLSPWTIISTIRGSGRTKISNKMLDGVVLVPSGGRSKNKSKSSRQVSVWVGRQDSWASEGGGRKELVTHGGKIRIVGELSGVRAILAYHPILSLTTLTGASLFTTFLVSILTFFLLSPSSFPSPRPKSVESGEKKLVEDGLPEPKLTSRKREQEWVDSLPKGMSNITGDQIGSSDNTDDDSSTEGLEDEALRVKEEEEEDDGEFDEPEEEVEAESNRSMGEKKDKRMEEERSLLGGSGTTPSTRSFGATTVLSSSDSSSISHSSSISRRRGRP
ncbi:Adipose-regulatory protein, Seipin [Phaffia rhodozyma]|uniref:Adipose-regulatory protein, Seipin n=1 Tax=Phaffia rhodozyma TaxID=264483 RepID=A0A0F7SLP2_PHARH|nr:Adipose-regulatory protein, Seipin [Phaffia rhodozyma]